MTCCLRAALILVCAASLARAERVAIKNAELELRVETSTGHVVFLGRPGGANLLYEDGMLGGEAIFPVQQVDLWFVTGAGSQKPDPTFWQSPWKLIKQDVRRIIIESAVSPFLQIRARRSFTLDRSAPRLQVETTLTRVAANPFPVHVWSVTRISDVESVLLDVAARVSEDAPGWRELSRPGRLRRSHFRDFGTFVQFLPVGELDHPKLGTLGSWIAAILSAKLALVQAVPLDPKGSYPDGSSVQVYANDDFVEIETLSVNRHLRPGQSLRSRAEWRLVNLPADPSPQARAGAIRRAIE